MVSSELIHHFLEESASRYPDKIALIHEGQRVPYRELNSLACRFSGCLREYGLGPGDRVVLLLENCLEYVISYYGLLKIGAVAVPLSPDLKSDTIQYLLGELEPKAVVASARAGKSLKEIDLGADQVRVLILKGAVKPWEARSVKIISWEDSVAGAEKAGGGAPFGDGALSSIIYTSGSTGRPKGVVLSHRNIVANTRAICSYLELTADDIQMVVLPFFYVMGKSLLNTQVAVGGTVVLNNKFAFPAAVLQEMISEHVTGFAGVPSTYAYLLHRSPLARLSVNLSALRFCAQAGGHMARELKEGLRRALPDHTKIYVMYGATEASARLTYLDPRRYLEKMDSIGCPIPGVSLRIVSPWGDEVPVRQIGELLATGPNIMQGYWKDQAATDQILKDKWYYTGDLAYQDEEGFYYVVGRKDYQVKVGGHRVNPQEVEDIILDSGLLVEAIVLGVPDTLLGNKIVALAVPRVENNKNPLIEYCHQKLPKYKVPSEIRLVKKLPKNAAGKVDREMCKDLLEGEGRDTALGRTGRTKPIG